MASEPTDWDKYYMNKPTDTTNWNPEEIIDDQEQEDYDKAWERICEGFLGIVVLVGIAFFVRGCV